MSLNDPDIPFGHPPLTQRDYFAAHVAAGLLSRTGYSPSTLAEEAYEYADALLKRRERP